MMKRLKPDVYINTRWEPREGSPYNQPCDYINDIELHYNMLRGTYFKDTFGKEFRDAQKESRCYDDTIKHSLYLSHFWTNEKARDEAFEKIYNFNLSGKSGSGSTVTPLFPFEIYMMNDGFEMVSFCEMNAIDPAFAIVSEKQQGDTLINPVGVKYSRSYKKDDYFVCLAFGIEVNGKKTNFYFKTSKNWWFEFQVSNDIKDYESAINGKLTPLQHQGNISNNDDKIFKGK